MAGWALLISLTLVVANAELRPKLPLKLPLKLALPNGSIITRPFSIYPLRPQTSLNSKDGKTILATTIEFICFNDSYVQVISLIRGGGGVFDSDSELSLQNTDYFDTLRASGLKVDGMTCIGYYAGMLGPRFYFTEANGRFFHLAIGGISRTCPYKTVHGLNGLARGQTLLRATNPAITR